MDTKFKTRTDVADKVDYEGLDYFLRFYSGADEMPDEELRKAFTAAKFALEHFMRLLPDVSGIDDDEDYGDIE